MAARIRAADLTAAQRAAIAPAVGLPGGGMAPATPRKRKGRNSVHTPLVNAVVAYLHARGAVVWQNDSGATFDPVKKVFRKAGKKRRGVADVIACWPPDGRFYAFEVKTGSARLTSDQEAFRDDVLRAGGVFVEVRSLDDVVKALEGKP